MNRKLQPDSEDTCSALCLPLNENPNPVLHVHSPPLSFVAVKFTDSEYTVYGANGVTCGDEVAFEVLNFDDVSVEVVPQNGTGKRKYHCLYTSQFFYQLRATTVTSFQMARTLRSRNAGLK